MRVQPKMLLAAAFVFAAATSPALALEICLLGDCIGDGGGGFGHHRGGGHGVPGPIAGAGAGYLVAAGGYYLYRRWRKQNTGK